MMRFVAGLFGAFLAATLVGGCGGGGGGAAGAAPQAFGRVVGKVLDNSGLPVAGALLLVRGTNVSVLSDPDGEFRLDNVPVGSQLIDVTSSSVTTTTIAIVQANQTVNIGTVSVSTPAGGSGGGTGGGTGGGGGVGSNNPPPPPF